MSLTVHVIHLLREQFDDPPRPFRCGKAGFFRSNAEGEYETEARIRLSANSTHALIGHGVVDELNGLGLEGEIGGGVPALIRPALIEDARSILYEADRNTYGGTWEFLVERTSDDPVIEYRVEIVNREYQVSLVRLIDVLNQASRIGEAVWIEI